MNVFRQSFRMYLANLSIFWAVLAMLLDCRPRHTHHVTAKGCFQYHYDDAEALMTEEIWSGNNESQTTPAHLFCTQLLVN